jgi:hypothetical protein
MGAHTAATRSVLCPSSHLWPRQLPTRNPASRFGYEGLGGPISAGAAHSFNGIAPSTPCAQLTSAIAQQAQQMCGVLPDRGRKEPSRRMRRQTCGILQSVWPYASKGSYACFQDPAKLKQTFNFCNAAFCKKPRCSVGATQCVRRCDAFPPRAGPSTTEHSMSKSPAEKSSIPRSLSKPRSRQLQRTGPTKAGPVQ